VRAAERDDGLVINELERVGRAGCWHVDRGVEPRFVRPDISDGGGGL